MEHHPNLVIVQVYGTRPEADLAKSVLDSAGIDAMTTADTAGGMREHLAWSGAGFQVLVREDDAKEARELLATADEAGSAQSQEEDPLKP
jgi:putative signal transducing protein